MTHAVNTQQYALETAEVGEVVWPPALTTCSDCGG